MASLLTVLGVYIVSSWFSRDPSAYEPLSFLLPPAWWAEAAGKGMVLALVWVTINCRLRSESLDWGALGWREFSWGRLARESAWGVACAGAVVAIGELFLNQGPNPSNRDAVERLVPIIDSPGAGKYAVLALGTLLTGIVEELVYRGVFFAFLGRTFGTGRRGLAAYVVLSSLSQQRPLAARYHAGACSSPQLDGRRGRDAAPDAARLSLGQREVGQEPPPSRFPGVLQVLRSAALRGPAQDQEPVAEGEDAEFLHGEVLGPGVRDRRVAFRHEGAAAVEPDPEAGDRVLAELFRRRAQGRGFSAFEEVAQPEVAGTAAAQEPHPDGAAPPSQAQGRGPRLRSS